MKGVSRTCENASHEDGALRTRGRAVGVSVLVGLFNEPLDKAWLQARLYCPGFPAVREAYTKARVLRSLPRNQALERLQSDLAQHQTEQRVPCSADECKKCSRLATTIYDLLCHQPTPAPSRRSSQTPAPTPELPLLEGPWTSAGAPASHSRASMTGTSMSGASGSSAGALNMSASLLAQMDPSVLSHARLYCAGVATTGDDPNVVIDSINRLAQSNPETGPAIVAAAIEEDHQRHLDAGFTPCTRDDCQTCVAFALAIETFVSPPI